MEDVFPIYWNSHPFEGTFVSFQGKTVFSERMTTRRDSRILVVASAQVLAMFAAGKRWSWKFTPPDDFLNWRLCHDQDKEKGRGDKYLLWSAPPYALPVELGQSGNPPKSTLQNPSQHMLATQDPKTDPQILENNIGNLIGVMKVKFYSEHSKMRQTGRRFGGKWKNRGKERARGRGRVKLLPPLLRFHQLVHQDHHQHRQAPERERYVFSLWLSSAW